ncbi:unnamed protein product [Camellia sinensis]
MGGESCGAVMVRGGQTVAGCGEMGKKWLMMVEGLIYSNSMAVYVLTNLVTFLTHIWKLKLKHAVAIMNIKGGAAGIMGLVEAALIDAYFGHARMLLITSALYSIISINYSGLGLLVMSVPDRFFSNGVKSCPAGEKLCSSTLTASPSYWGLALIVLAKASQGICLRALTFGKIKFKRDPPKMKEIKFGFLKFEVPQRKIQDKRKHQKNIIRNTCNIVGTAGGITWVFVLLAAFLKGHLDSTEQGTELNYGDEDQTPQGQGRNQKTPRGPKKRMTLTDHCWRLNNAAINVPRNFHCFPIGWINCIVDEVEETKLLLRMVPISTTFLLYGVIKSNKHGLLGNPDAIAPISVFWLSPQFVLMGIMDGLARDGMEDFFRCQVPKSMRKRYALVLTEAVIGFGKLLNIWFIMMLDVVVEKLRVEDGSWIADIVNQSRLDLFYASLVVVSIANLFIFACVASFYTYRDFPEEEDDEEEDPHEEIKTGKKQDKVEPTPDEETEPTPDEETERTIRTT